MTIHTKSATPEYRKGWGLAFAKQTIKKVSKAVETGAYVDLHILHSDEVRKDNASR